MRDGLLRFGRAAGRSPGASRCAALGKGRVAGEREHLRLADGTGTARGAGDVQPAGCRRARRRRAADSAASISALTMRPCGPEPRSAARSSPACTAMRRANGLAKIAAVRAPLPVRRGPACPSRAAGEWRPPAGGRRVGAAGGAVRAAPAARLRCAGAARPLAAAAVERRRVLALFEQEGDRLVDLDALRRLREPGSCRAGLRRPPRIPSSPCRSRSRR